MVSAKLMWTDAISLIKFVRWERKWVNVIEKFSFDWHFPFRTTYTPSQVNEMFTFSWLIRNFQHFAWNIDDKQKFNRNKRTNEQTNERFLVKKNVGCLFNLQIPGDLSIAFRNSNKNNSNRSSNSTKWIGKHCTQLHWNR